jgi:small-conductance mechanosensitive channel
VSDRYASRDHNTAGTPAGSVGDVVAFALRQFANDFVAALPNIVAGTAFLVIAAVGVKLVMAVVGFTLKRALPGESPVYRQFFSTIVLVFLWFGVDLSFLAIVGLDGIAASLGTATGFLALGVSYALSGMIADAVAGVYLLRDPDFNPGYQVDIGGTVGEVKAIELRKTRLDMDGDTVVRGNAEIERKWTRKAEAASNRSPVDGI